MGLYRKSSHKNQTKTNQNRERKTGEEIILVMFIHLWVQNNIEVFFRDQSITLLFLTCVLNQLRASHCQLG